MSYPTYQHHPYGYNNNNNNNNQGYYPNNNHHNNQNHNNNNTASFATHNNNNHHHHNHHHSTNNAGDDETFSRIEAGVSHLQNLLTQVNSMSTNAGTLGDRFVELLDSVDQLRQERDSSSHEISRLRHENLAVHNSLRALLRIIERFSSVEDPVVASDGYTYERRDIAKYFEDCKQTSTVARSHLTQEDLQESVLVPNLSMKRMLTLLQEVEVPILGQAYYTNITNSHVNNNNNNRQQQNQASNTTTASSSNVNNNNNNNQSNQTNSNGPNLATSSTTTTNNGNSNQNPTVSIIENISSLPDNSGSSIGPFLPHNNSNLNTSQSQSPQYNGARRRSSDLMNHSSSTHNPTNNNNNRSGGGSRRQSLQSPVHYSGKLHPCVRVYGRCKFEDECVFAKYPYEVCLSFLKGKCRFGSTCLEPHVEFSGDQTQVASQFHNNGSPQSNGNSRRASVQH